MKKRLNQLTELTALQTTDLVYVERVAGLVATGYKAQASNLPGGFGYFKAIQAATMTGGALIPSTTTGSLGSWNGSNQWVAPATGLYLAQIFGQIDAGSVVGFARIYVTGGDIIAETKLDGLDDSIVVNPIAIHPVNAGGVLYPQFDINTGSLASTLGTQFTVARLA